MDPQSLEAIYGAALAGDQAARQQVNELSGELQLLPVALQVMQLSQNPSVRFYAAISVNKILKTRGVHELSPADKAGLFQELVTRIETEPGPQNRRYLCEIAADIRLTDNEYDEIPHRAAEIAMEFLGKGKLDIAFALLVKTLDHLPREQQVVVANRVYEPCTTAMVTSEDEGVRIAAMEMMQLLADDTSDDALTTIIECPGDFPGVVMKATERIMLGGGSPQEATAFFAMMEKIISSLTPFFTDHHRDFAMLVVGLLTNKEIDPYVRLPAARMLETVYELSVDMLIDVSNVVLQNELEFAIELCELDPGSEDYTFPSDFVAKLSELIEHDKFFGFVFEMVMKMLETKLDAAVIVGLSMLCCLIRCTMEELLEYEEQVLQIVVACLEHPHVLVAEGAAKVIHVMCEVLDSDVTAMVDVLVRPLMRRFDILWCDKALNKVLTSSEEPPSYIDEMIQETLELLKNAPKQVHERIVALLCSELSCYDRVNPEMYGIVGPIMSELMSGDVAQKALAVKCFSILIEICPEQAAKDVQAVIPVVLSLFCDDDYERNSLCCECIDGIMTSQFSSIIPFVGDIIKALETVHQLPLLEMEADDEEGTAQQDLAFSAWNLMKLAALATMVTMCSLLPEQLSDRFGDIFNLLVRNISDADPEMAVAACNNLSILAEGYQAVGADGGPFFEKILGAIQSQAGELLVAGWTNLGILMELFGEATVKRFAPNINGCLLGAFTHARDVYNQKGDSSEFARDLEEPIFNALNKFVKVLKAEAGPYLQEYIPILESLAENGKRKSHGKAAYSLAVIASVIPEAVPVLQMATQVALKDLQAKASDVRVAAMATLNIALHASREAMAAVKDALLDYTTQIIKSVADGSKECTALIDTAASLWLSLIQIYEFPADEALVASVFNFVHLRCDDECLVSFCDFMGYAARVYPAIVQQQLPYLATMVLASKPSFLRLFQPDALRTLVACVQENMDAVRENTACHEVLMRNVQRNIKAISQ